MGGGIEDAIEAGARARAATSLIPDADSDSQTYAWPGLKPKPESSPTQVCKAGGSQLAQMGAAPELVALYHACEVYGRDSGSG